MISIIKNVKVYSPEYIGVNDILICNGVIEKIAPNISITSNSVDLQVIDGRNKIAVPGFIDQHVHIIGGGGEGGFHSRTPEVVLSKIIEAGTTTVVGLLGTDGTTRHIESLYAKSKALEFEGITSYICTGSYEINGPTITNSIKKDIMFIDNVIGLKIAFSDHRSSHITKEELIRLVSEVRVSGMLAQKAGIVVMHMGDDTKTLKMVMDILKDTDIPINHFCPTHVNRNGYLFNDAMEFAKLGGLIDITAGTEDNELKGSLKASNAILKCILNDVPLENVTISTDGNGSTSEYDPTGKILKFGMSSLDTMYKEFKDLILKEDFDVSIALKFFTTNVAKKLKLYPKKGSIMEKSDADILLLDHDLNINTVIAKGNLMMKNRELLVKGTYEF
ncbi:beta-aspartyl-peptidase [Haloimpatiens massiliensis]|uniref:beta-aspartyl-peptidase n=1 Tax=Haloimpatiens massiliensis TaxID=1658110 RepID=UPI000C816BC5|nr:beta-aspartyl-peptidase [Haloimpatiens massiliensis]